MSSKELRIVLQGEDNLSPVAKKVAEQIGKMKDEAIQADEEIVRIKDSIRSMQSAKSSAKKGLFDTDIIKSKELKSQLDVLIAEYKKLANEKSKTAKAQLKTTNAKIEQVYTQAINEQRHAIDNLNKSKTYLNDKISDGISELKDEVKATKKAVEEKTKLAEEEKEKARSIAREKGLAVQKSIQDSKKEVEQARKALYTRLDAYKKEKSARLSSIAEKEAEIEKNKALKQKEYEEIKKQARIKGLATQKAINDAKKLAEEESLEAKKSLQSRLDAYKKEKAARLSLQAQKEKEAQEEKARQESLRKSYERTYLNTSAQNTYNDSKQKLNEMLKNGVISQNEYNSALKKEKENLKQNSIEQKNSTNSLVRHIRQLESMAVALYAVKKAYDATLGVGLDYNILLENEKRSLSATYMLKLADVDATGKQISTTQKWTLSQKLANKAFEELVEVNKQTPHTLGQTIQIYRTLFGTSKQYGVSQEKLIKLTKLISIAAGSANVQFQPLLASIDGLASGTVKANSDLGKMLVSMGLTNSSIKEAAKTGSQFDLVIDKIHELEVAGKLVQTQWAGITTNLKTQWDILWGDSQKPLFEEVKKDMVSFTKYLEENRTQIEQYVEDVLGYVKQAGTLGLAILTGLQVQKVVKAYSLIEGATLGVASAQKILNKSLLANPYVLAVTAMWGLYEAITAANDAYERQDRILKEREKASKGFTGKGILEDLKFDEMSKNLATSYDNMIALQKAYETVKDANAKKWYKKQLDEATSHYKKLEKEIIKYSNKTFKIEDNSEKNKAELRAKFKTMEKEELDAAKKLYNSSFDAGIDGQEQKLKQKYENLLSQSKHSFEARILLKKWYDKEYQKLEDKRSEKHQANLEKRTSKLRTELNNRLKAQSDYIQIVGTEEEKFQDKLAQQMSALGESGALTAEQLKKAFDVLNENHQISISIKENKDWIKSLQEFEKIDIDKGLNDQDSKVKDTFKDWSDTLNSSISNSIVDAIQNGDVTGALQGLGSSIGSSMLQSSVSNLVAGGKQLESAGGLTSMGGLGGIAAGVGITAIMGVLNKSSKTEEQKLQEYYAKIDKQTKSIVDAINSQTEVLGHFGQNFDSLIKEFDKAKATYKGDVNKAPRSIIRDLSVTRSSLYKTDIANEDDPMQTVRYLLSTTRSEAIKYINSSYKGMLVDAGTLYDQLKKHLDKVLPEIKTFTNEYISSILKVKDTYSNLSDSLKSVYDNLNSSYYESKKLQKAQSEVNTIIGNSTLSEFLKNTISGLDAYGTTIENLKNDLTGDDFLKKLDAIKQLEDATGKSFDKNVGKALDYIDSIKLVGDAMATSSKNIKTYEDSFKSQEQLASDMVSKFSYNTTEFVQYDLGQYIQTTTKHSYELAKSYTELDDLYKKLKNDSDGLTDAELKALQANKQYIDSLDTVQSTMNSLYESTKSWSNLQKELDAQTNKAITEKINILNGVLSSSDSAINSLTSSNGVEELSKYYEAIKKANSLRNIGGQDYADAVKNASQYVSALKNSSNFANKNDMLFAQQAAKNNFTNIKTDAQNQIDILNSQKVVEESQLNVLKKIETTMSGIRSSLILRDGAIEAINNKNYIVQVGNSVSSDLKDIFDTNFKINTQQMKNWLNSNENILDINNDGISEAMQGFNKIGQKFVDIDSNGDGILDMRLLSDSSGLLANIQQISTNGIEAKFDKDGILQEIADNTANTEKAVNANTTSLISSFNSSATYTNSQTAPDPRDYQDPEDYYDAMDDYNNGYANGGYTGDIGRSAIAGLVHGQEYVVNAQTTQDLGLNNGNGGVFKEMLSEIKNLRKANEQQEVAMAKMATELSDIKNNTERDYA